MHTFIHKIQSNTCIIQIKTVITVTETTVTETVLRRMIKKDKKFEITKSFSYFCIPKQKL